MLSHVLWDFCWSVLQFNLYYRESPSLFAIQTSVAAEQRHGRNIGIIMSHRIQCQCGSLTGAISNTATAMHAVCYCIDCRTYAFHLGNPKNVLDAMGGT